MATFFESFLTYCHDLKRPVRRNLWWRDWSGRLWSDSEAQSNRQYEPCVRCGAKSGIRAWLPGGRGNGPLCFIPEGCRLAGGVSRGVSFHDSRFLACLSCGLVWSQVDPEEFQRHVEEHGDGTTIPAKVSDDL